MMNEEQTTPERPVRSIAFRTGRGLGDAVLCEPLVRAVAAAYPDAELTVLLPASCNGIDRFGFGGDRFAAWVEGEEFAEYADGFDLAIDADPAAYDQPFESVRDSGARLVNLFAHYRPDAAETTAYERMAEGLARIGVCALEETPTLTVPPSVRAEAQDALASLNLRPDVPTVVIHPGSSASYAFKRWYADGFGFLADEFLKNYDANIVFVGSGSEGDLLAELQANMARGARTVTAFNWPLDHLTALLETCDLFIGNDSGVGHLTAALGRPVVTIAGPTAAHFWAPLTDRALVTPPGGCCYNPSTCGVWCLKSIRACEVEGAAEALLTATTQRAKYPCLDAVRVAGDLEVTPLDGDAVVLRSRLWDMPMTIERGRDYVLRVLHVVTTSGSARCVRQAFPDSDPLLEQCFRHAIIQPGHDPSDPHEKETSLHVK